MNMMDSRGDRVLATQLRLTTTSSSDSTHSSKLSTADNSSTPDVNGSLTNGHLEENDFRSGIAMTQSERRPEKLSELLRANLLLNGHESKSSPMPIKLRLAENLACRRPRSLAGPSPHCRFGPKAQLFEPTGDEEDAVSSITHYDPGTTRLNWYTLPQSVLVIKKPRDHDVLEPFIKLIRCLLLKNMQVFVEQTVLSEENLQKCELFAQMKGKLSTFLEGCDGLNDKIDFIVCLGGDGTLLYASSLFQTSVPPVMAFHLGSLGFLTPFEFENEEKKIESVLNGHANLTLRSRLKCVIRNKESKMGGANHSPSTMTPPSITLSPSTTTPPSNTNGRRQKDDATFVILNDVVIDRGPSPYLVHIDLFADGQLVTAVQGDGLIISTPTGSTAYAVAAGASIIHPGVPAIMITPICPHSLSFRPIVVPAGCELRVRVSENARDSAWVSFDGRNRQELSIGDSLRITTSVYPLPSICEADQMQDWFNGLAGCLHWNVRKPQKPWSDS